MQRHEMNAQIEARKERAARHVKLARRIQDIAAEKLNNPRYAKKVHQARDILAYARTGVEIERQVSGDAQLKEEQPTQVYVNPMIMIKAEVAALRARLIAEFTERQRQKDEQAKSVEALPAPADEVIDAPHPNYASCANNPALQPPTDPPAEEPREHS
jgi:hypothetical protein